MAWAGTQPQAMTMAAAKALAETWAQPVTPGGHSAAKGGGLSPRGSYPFARLVKNVTRFAIQLWTSAPAFAGSEMIHTTISATAAQPRIRISTVASFPL